MPSLWDDDLPFWDDDSAVWDEEEETPAMTDTNRIYKFADSILYSESGLIIAACTASAPVSDNFS